VGDGLAVGYARCSIDEQGLTAQREALSRLGVPAGRVYVDHGRTGTNRDRPGLRQALAAVRPGDTLVVTKLDRLARSVPDARNIVDELTAGGVRLSIGGCRCTIRLIRLGGCCSTCCRWSRSSRRT